jgi:hypothetical protein
MTLQSNLESRRGMLSRMSEMPASRLLVVAESVSACMHVPSLPGSAPRQWKAWPAFVVVMRASFASANIHR